jgi:hypothetical protein
LEIAPAMTIAPFVISPFVISFVACIVSCTPINTIQNSKNYMKANKKSL